MNSKKDFLRRLRARLSEEYENRLGSPLIASRQGAKTPESSLKGKILAEYEVLDEIGRGGMGIVYRAHQMRLGRKVALKVLKDEHRASESVRKRFLREMKTAGRLSHPNIVQALDARCEEDGTLYLVFELLEGADVSKLLRIGSELSISNACEIIRQTADGLRYTHEQRLVHRDIKPSNLFIALQRDAQGKVQGARVKILDLGMASINTDPADASLTSLGQVIGTIDYIAPEQIHRDQDIDIRADLYSLGCTLYHLIGGAAPFSYCSGTYEKLCAHREERPPSLKEVVKDVPEELSGIVDRLLEKAPTDRFQTPAELIEALTPYCKHADLLKIFPDPERTLADVKPVQLTRQGRSPQQARSQRIPPKLTTFSSPLFWGGGGIAVIFVLLFIWMQPREQPESDAIILLKPEPASVAQAAENSSGAERHDRALMLNGIDEVIDTGYYYQSGEPITFEMWLTPLATSDRRKKELISNAESAGISLSIKEDSNLFFQFHDGVYYVPVDRPNSIAPTEKVHVAAVYSGIGTQLYVNGTAEGAPKPVRRRHLPSPLPIHLGANPDPALDGRDEATLRDCFRGLIHQFRITRGPRYTENFTPAEILTSEDETEVLYHLHAGQGQIVQDLSGNGYDGTIYGGTWVNLHELNFDDERTPFSWPSDIPAPAIAPFDAAQAQEHQLTWANFWEVPVERTIEFDGAAPVHLTLIPPGEFLMGTAVRDRTRLLESDSLRWNDYSRNQLQTESPQHIVRITKPFYISRYETTRGQYRVFCRATGYPFPVDLEPLTETEELSETESGTPVDADDLPMTRITWNDAIAYCAWLGRHTGVSVSLPTEAQWEYCCRAGTQTDWHFGDDPADLNKYAWHSDNSNLQLQSIGRLKPNAWGLYDMHGNAAEWCRDYWRESGYTTSARVDPEFGAQDSYHNVRGGSAISWPVLSRSASRGLQQARVNHPETGFRIIVELPMVSE